MRLVVAVVGALASSNAIAAADQGDGIALGPLRTFSGEAAAAAVCPDGVVWADRRTGFYYPRFAPEYGRTADGAFACYGPAEAAGYWGFGTADGLAGVGRTFPLVPDPICTWYQDKGGRWRCGRVGS